MERIIRMPHKNVNDKETVRMTWGDALHDAQKQLVEAKKRVRELMRAVRACEQMVRDGEPFPGDVAMKHVGDD